VRCTSTSGSPHLPLVLAERTAVRVLVTGATGFIGHELCKTLTQAGHVVRAALRTEQTLPPGVSERSVVGTIGAATEWEDALSGADAVVHLAARAHVVREPSTNTHLYAETNSNGTRTLANAARRAGLRRFVYLSSVKVNGEETISRAYTSDDEPRPRDAYGVSKWWGERYLMEAAEGCRIEPVVVRPPLVYGPGVGANFLRLMRWVDNGWPLPFGGVRNRRSLVSIWNLCDFLVNVLENPAAPGRIWMVSDNDDLSTPELITRLARAMDRRVHLLSVPTRLLERCGALIGRRADVARLSRSLVIDVGKTCEKLGWAPPVAVDQALARTVAWYLSAGRSVGV
jgi:nucleoside-diphosphate-sugar epimerase